jgi:hypothetical protein
MQCDARTTVPSPPAMVHGMMNIVAVSVSVQCTGVELMADSDNSFEVPGTGHHSCCNQYAKQTGRLLAQFQTHRVFLLCFLTGKKNRHEQCEHTVSKSDVSSWDTCSTDTCWKYD